MEIFENDNCLLLFGVKDVGSFKKIGSLDLNEIDIFDDTEGVWKERLSLYEKSINICRKSGIQENSICVALEDLVVHKQSISEFLCILDEDISKFKIEHSMEDADEKLLENVACTMFINTFIGEVRVGVCCAFLGKPEKRGENRYLLHIKDREFGDFISSHVDEKLSSEDVVNLLDSFESKYDRDDMTVVSIRDGLD